MDKENLAIWATALVLLAMLPITVQVNKPQEVVPPVPATVHIWAKADSLAYANDQIQVFADKQMACLSNLWGKESAWNPKAKNYVKSQGKHAGGIPQLLGMSPATLPTSQIDRGLSYIYYRYTTPCQAWKHWQKWRWY